MVNKKFSLVLLTGFFSLFAINFVSAEMLNTPEENASYLKKGIQHVESALELAKNNDGDKSLEHAEAALQEMKEINSEGWAPKLERSFTSIRYGSRAAQKGQFDQAVKEYEDALKKLKKIKVGDMTYSHDSFF